MKTPGLLLRCALVASLGGFRLQEVRDDFSGRHGWGDPETSTSRYPVAVGKRVERAIQEKGKGRLQEGRDIKRQTGIRLAALVAALLTSSCKCSWPKRFQHYPRDFLR